MLAQNQTSDIIPHHTTAHQITAKKQFYNRQNIARPDVSSKPNKGHHTTSHHNTSDHRHKTTAHCGKSASLHCLRAASKHKPNVDTFGGNASPTTHWTSKPSLQQFLMFFLASFSCFAVGLRAMENGLSVPRPAQNSCSWKFPLQNTTKIMKSHPTAILKMLWTKL